MKFRNNLTGAILVPKSDMVIEQMSKSDLFALLPEKEPKEPGQKQGKTKQPEKKSGKAV